MTNLNDMPRWKRLRLRAYAMGVHSKTIAERIGYNVEYTRQLLRDDKQSEPGLDNIERVLDEIEAERQTAAAA